MSGGFLDYQQAQMSSVCWIINRRLCLMFDGFLKGANGSCLLDH